MTHRDNTPRASRRFRRRICSPVLAVVHAIASRTQYNRFHFNGSVSGVGSSEPKHVA